MISTELNSIFQKALTFAKDQRHEYLTIEHVFLALLTNSEGSAIITECQGNVTWMREKLGEYIVQTMQPLPDELEQDPFETVALSRLIDKMIRHVQSAQKKEATIGDLVASIFEEEHSFAYTLLQEQKIDRVDVLEVISHQDSKKAPGDESALETYCINLLDKAQKDQIDPIIGRETEIERTIQVLCRRKKNNPLLLGEPGVGKTAIAEGLALKVSQGDVPEILQNAQLYALDLGTLLAGTKYRGDFEKRLKSVMKELSELPHALLFIDEIHTIVGAGSVSGGSMDASNQLKPALASGALTVIGATTYAEFRNVLDKDKALSRRFARIDIKEPSIEDSIKILKGLRPKYEQHHKVTYSDNSLRSAVELSKRFINDRFLPDVAIDLIDETGASFHLKNSKKKNVTVSDIEHTIARILQIPPSQVSQDDLKLLKDLETKMHKRIIGQDKAVTLVAQAVKRGRAGLTSQTKPVASFLFSGPTGVGKTELSKTLADLLGIHFERLDMSEYMEKHAVSRLVG
ncbi:MAG: AAA family ATPase, partial [Thiovulaceae bacterium]|nr:AAA family ATPase [Sulfurimonadaceae bacterium]